MASKPIFFAIFPKAGSQQHSSVKLDVKPHFPQRLDLMLDFRFDNAGMSWIQAQLLHRRPEDPIPKRSFRHDDPAPNPRFRAVRRLKPAWHRLFGELRGSPVGFHIRGESCQRTNLGSLRHVAHGLCSRQRASAKSPHASRRKTASVGRIRALILTRLSIASDASNPALRSGSVSWSSLLGMNTRGRVSTGWRRCNRRERQLLSSAARANRRCRSLTYMIS